MTERGSSFDKPAVLLLVLGGLASALTVNIPSVLEGYGLVYVMMLLAAWRYKPKTAALVVLGVMLVALPFYLVPASVFTSVGVFSVIVRPVLTYLAGVARVRYGRFASAVSLTVFETLIALSIDIGYFGSGDAGLAIFGIILAPFAYGVVLAAGESGSTRVVGMLASLAALLAYYFAFYGFAAVWTGFLAALSLLPLLAASRRVAETTRKRSVFGIALLLPLIGSFLGGTQLSNNVSVALYPFEPHSWTSSRWEQQSPGVCPATNNVFSGTWSPARLRIVNTCATAVGTVGELVAVEEDGDFSFNIKVNQTYAGMVSLGSALFERGELHVEVVPSDQHRLLDPLGGGVCPGDLVKVTGVLVLDTDHGMGSELHPAMGVMVLRHATGSPWPGCTLGRSVNP